MPSHQLHGEGKIMGEPAPDFKLPDENTQEIKFSDLYKKSHTLLVFFPGGLKVFCTKQLCNYRDHFDDFNQLGIQVVGVCPDAPGEIAQFRKKFKIPFMILSDPPKLTNALYQVSGSFLFGRYTRAVFIVNKKGLMLYRYIEPTPLTRRSANELLHVMQDLKNAKLI